MKNMTDEELDNMMIKNIQIEANRLPASSRIIIPVCRLGDLEEMVRKMLRLLNRIDI